jgi:TRAP-type C4-dicarboxylate transport system permease small subunit
LNALEAAYGRLLAACAALAAALVFAVMAMFTLSVVLRALVGGHVEGDMELSEYAMLLITALTAPWLLRLGRHVRLDVVLVNLPPRLAWVCELVCDAIGFTVSLLLVSYGWRVLVASHSSGTRIVKEFTIPEWWVLWPLPLMFAFVAVEFMFRFRRVALGPRQARVEGGQL